MDDTSWTAKQPCGVCNGDGGFEQMPTGPHDTGQWSECRACCGTGEVEVEYQPVDLDDLDEADAVEALEKK